MLKSRPELKKFREESLSSYQSQTTKIIVCAGTGCVAGGSLEVYSRLK